MSKKALAVVAVAIVAGLGVAVVVWRTTRPTLTPAMKKDVGAADYVPADVSVYSSALHLARRWRQVWRSNAVQRLVALPLVQQAWLHPQVQSMVMRLTRALQTNPVLVEALPVLEDAVSTEVFLCAGPGLPGFLGAVNEVGRSIQLGQLGAMAGGPPGVGPPPGFDLPRLVDVVLDNKERLRMPSGLLGFRLADPQRAQQFLDKWVPRIGPTPVGLIEKKPVQATKQEAPQAVSFYVLEIKAETLGRRAFADLPRLLARSGVPREKAQQLVQWLNSQTLAIAVGLQGHYLLVSLGKDTSMLTRWGRGQSLARSRELAPFRARYKPGLMSISYTSRELARQTLLAPADIRSMAEAFMRAIPEGETSAKLKKRLRQDVGRLAAELEAPEPSGTLAFSFENRGIETFSFGGTSAGALDCSEPLSIVAHRGKQPMGFSAGRTVKNPGAYDNAAKWLKVAFGYFEDFAVPRFSPEDRKQYEKVMALVRPFLREVDSATREDLVPSIDGIQSLLVLDGHGSLGKLPDGKTLKKPIPLPRLGIAAELNDATQFVRAIGRYAAAIRELMDGAKRAFPGKLPPGLALPEPPVADAAGGKLYYYKLPWDLGRDVLPCALLKGNLLVLATSRGLAVEMADTAPMPAGEVVHTDEPAGAVTVFDGTQCWDTAERVSDSVFALLRQTGAIRPEQGPMAMQIKMHLDTLWVSLGAIRGYTGTTTMANGRLMTHSWLHVEDVGR